MKPQVYLAGPISGCTYGECVDWREFARTWLAPLGITGLSPMRYKDHLKALDTIGPTDALYKHMSVLSNSRGITTRDRYDTQRSDLVLVNLLGATKVSIGTMIELGWADSARRPLIVVMEPDGTNPHEHAIVSEVTGFRVDTLEQALDVVRAILVPWSH